MSAEYPGIAVAKVAAATGAITLFITGAIGDVGPVDRGMESMQAIGQAIGNEACACWQRNYNFALKPWQSRTLHIGNPPDCS